MQFSLKSLSQSLLLASALFVLPVSSMADDTSAPAQAAPAAAAATTESTQSMAGPTGKEIFNIAAKRHALPYEFSEESIVLHDKQGNKIERKMSLYSRKGDDGLHKYLLVFKEPEGVKGVALLMWEEKGEADSQWLFLPSGGDLKRILAGAKRNYFMGTDFAFEDLSAQKYDDFNCERKPDQEINGKKVFVIDVSPNNPKAAEESGYKSRTVYILQDIYQPVKVDFYDRRGNLFKVETFDSFKNISGDAYRPEHVTMTNLKQGSSTEITIVKSGFDEKDVPEEMFTKRYITSKKHMAD